MNELYHVPFVETYVAPLMIFAVITYAIYTRKKSAEYTFRHKRPDIEAPVQGSQSPIPQIGWMAIQFAIFLFFVFGNIYWQWGMGSASAIAGGMIAWYSTGIADHYLTRWYRRRRHL